MQLTRVMLAGKVFCPARAAEQDLSLCAKCRMFRGCSVVDGADAPPGLAVLCGAGSE